VEFDTHLVIRDRNIGGRVDDVSEDLSRLGVKMATHATGKRPMEPAGND